MKIVDLNILLYAVNRDSVKHSQASSWLKTALTESEVVALPWVVILGFLRITTRHGIFAQPLSFDQAAEVVDEWLTRPNVSVLRPGDGHWKILRRLLQSCGTAGNLTTDAHLATLAIEYGGCLYSSDHDFARFGNQLRYRNPLL